MSKIHPGSDGAERVLTPVGNKPYLSVFKAVTHLEKGQVLSAQLPNVQQAIWTAALALNEC